MPEKKMKAMKTAIKLNTNERFDNLTNADISKHYQNIKIYLVISDFLSTLAYWIIKQNPNIEIIETKPILLSYQNSIRKLWKNIQTPEEFTYKSLRNIINEKEFCKIPEILALNNLKPDFIDIGALSRNVFHMILRVYIT